MSEVTGYNREKVEEVEKFADTVYSDLCTTLGELVQNGLVIPMSQAWYAPEAQTEFNGNITTAVKKLGTNMYDAYYAFVDWVDTVGWNWADNTGGEYPEWHQIGTYEITIDTSIILDNNGGNVTLDEAEAERIAGNMEDLKQSMLDAAKAAHGKLSAASAFMGHGQAAAAEACFVRVADAIGQTFKLMETLGERIKEYAKKYRDVATEITAKFGEAEVEVKES